MGLAHSTDILQQMRINVSEENSDKVIWYKERYLTDEEIVEHIVHNPSNSVCWTIHRPKRGWYIRLRHPSFPPGTFIPFMPVPPSSPYHVDGALSFNSRTNAPGASNHVVNQSIESSNQFVVQDDAGSSTSSQGNTHSYPPTPPTVVVRPPSVAGIISVDNGNLTRGTPGPAALALRSPRPMQITQFILAPHSLAPQVPVTDSFFSRALSVIKSHRPSHSRSFTLSCVPQSPHSPPPPYTSRSTVALDADMETSTPSVPLAPLLIHHDRTPVLTIGSFTGLIEIDASEERMLGVDRSFWIAVALTYLEFLENRDSYLAALSD
ncbi:hypothetical protein AX15_006863 [Amanita polypyramis BW_CC]|nr:hypothetical protein AX15_006863 [Amanita polypyramis BW_CC]